MKLFLASSLDQVFGLFMKKLGKDSSDLKVLLIANPADSYKNTWWIDLDRKAFQQNGFKVEDTDLRQMDQNELQKRLDNAHILHVCGGSVLYFINLLREKKLFEPIRNAVKNGQVIYTGTSAGSMVVAPDLSLSKYDQEEAEFVPATSDYTGLNLVNFYINPHCQNVEFLLSTKEMVKHLPDNKTPLLFLNDNQAVWVEDEKIEILSI